MTESEVGQMDEVGGMLGDGCDDENVEEAVNRLGEALLLIHGLMNPLARRADCTEEQINARLAYSHVHGAIKFLAKVGGHARRFRR